jgi:hypothetical protein
VADGSYTIIAIQDVAGNALDGNYYGTFPTGDGLPGGDFVATIATFHNKVLPGVPIRDGFDPPSAATIDPPAHSAPTHKPKPKHHEQPASGVVSRPSHLIRAHDVALGSLTIKHKLMRPSD